MATVAQAIDPANRYRDMFEPFNKHEVYASRHFNSWLYLRPSDPAARYANVIGKVVSGKLHERSVDRWNRRTVYTKRLIRETRANLWLKWLTNTFPDLTMILVLRHPCTIASGSLLLERMDRFSSLLSQPDLMQDHLQPFKDVLANVNDKFDKYVFSWCIQHYVPLRQFAPGQLHLVFYETLCAQPEIELSKLSTLVRGSFASGLSEEKADRLTNLRRKAELLDPWRKHLTSHQIRRTVEILRIFGLDKIYCEETMPDIAAAYRFLEAAAR
ncbi:MAG: sulfotransferase [Candidatus Eremiobacteraeota bacterium]|nr:sulfotransferase [Candidatus Eremiobacteraeota bacterium]